jgi:hypothetical protein
MARRRKVAPQETKETVATVVPKPKRQRTQAAASGNGNAVQVTVAAGALEFITSSSTGSNDQPAYSRVGVGG